MHLFHYTDKNGFNGIKNNFLVKGEGSSFVVNAVGTDGEPAKWMPISDDVQKGSWISKQHDKGFYLTDFSPQTIGNDDAAKMGINANVDTNLYVMVFLAQARDGDFYIGDNKVRRVKNTRKYYITTNAPDGKMPIVPPAAVWCGKVLSCPVFA